MIFPEPVPGTDPAHWPEILLAAATVFLEAEGEPVEGKHGVAWVIQTRAEHNDTGLLRAILGADGTPGRFDPFSCWNDDYWSQRKSRLIGIDRLRWAQCWDAAVGAYFHRIVDPTFGADHYLNVELTRRLRSLHDLPRWVDLSKTTAVIGKHTFLKIGLP